MEPRDLEAWIRADPGVADALLLERETLAGSRELVAYVVPAGTGDVMRLREHLISRLPPAARPLQLVCLPSAPLTAEGSWDVAAVQALPVVDDVLIAKAEQDYRALPHVRRVAALPITQIPPAKPWHLSDILPDWSRRTVGRAAGARARLATSSTDERTGQGPLAISDGGRLVMTEEAPRVLVDLLAGASHASHSAGIVCYGSEGREERFSYLELAAAARSILAGLIAAGLQPADHLIFQLGSNRDFLETFWACVLGGIIPVPTGVAASYGELNAAVQRLGDATKMLGGAKIATTADMLADLRTAAALLGVQPFDAIAIDTLRSLPPVDGAHVGSADDVALMMLTSGSTGAPKGVPLTHRNLIGRTLGSCAVNGFEKGMVSLNWMPLDHVAGLLYFHLRDVYLAAVQVHVATDLVLRDPLLWLDLLERYRVSVTFAPNFAFGLVTGVLEDNRQRGWDLSCVRSVLNGGEAIVAETARKFLSLLAVHGLRPDVMHPAWGMSETSSGITYCRDFSLETTSDDDPNVKVGRPIPGDRLRIVDDTDNVVAEGQIGHLHVAGITVFGGYYGNAQPYEETFTADGWFRTGDLGRLVDGELTITGRAKDVIIINGANYSGPAIEAAVEEIRGVARTFTAACGVPDPRADGSEGLAVFFVPEPDDDDVLQDLLKSIRQRVVLAVGISPAFIVPLKRSDIPKTSIGKIQRGALRKALEAGQFEMALRRVDVLSGSGDTLPRWFFRRTWHRKTLCSLVEPVSPGAVLLVGGPEVVAAAIAARIEARGGLALRVTADDIGSGADDTQDAALASLVARSCLERGPVQAAVYLGNYCSTPEPAGRPGDDRIAVDACARFLAFMRGVLVEGGPTDILAVSRGVENVTGDDPVDCARAAVVPLVHSLVQERGGVRARHVDVGNEEPGAVAQIVWSELGGRSANREIAYRNGARFVPLLEPHVASDRGDGRTLLVPGGTYVITGGLGGVAVELAGFLLRRLHARVLLIGRSALPAQDHRAGRGADPHRAAHAASLEALEALPGHVSYAVADVSDSVALQTVVASFVAASGSPAAFFHLAGEYHEVALVAETRAGLAATFAPKIGGAAALLETARSLGDVPIIAFSSVTSVFGGAMVGTYAAANRYLDALAEHGGHRGWVTIDWSSWRQTGLNLRFGAAEPLRAMGVAELSIDQAIASLQVALASSARRVVVGLDATNPFVARNVANLPILAQVKVFSELEPATRMPEAGVIELTDRYGTRCPVSNVVLDALPLNDAGEVDRVALVQVAERGRSFKSPATPTERTVAQVWRRVLSLDVIDAEAGFFELGGQSLLATQMIAALNATFHVALTLRDVFAAPTVRGLAARIVADAGEEGQAPIAAVDRAQSIPLGRAQQRLWFLDRVHPANAAFHVPAVVRFASMPDAALLERCLQAIVQRHESLRTAFPILDGEPCQRIAATLALKLRVEDLPAGGSFDLLAEAEARAPFDLTTGPLIRGRLVRFADGGAALLVTLHHIVSDGWSMKVFFRELLALYSTGAARPLPPLSSQYADYTRWQHGVQSTERAAQQLRYWRSQLAGNLHGFALPTDRSRPRIQTYAGARRVATIPPPLTRRVRDLARDQGVTLFVTLLTAFKELLSRYAQQDDIIVGTVVANRDRPEFAPMIGFLVNLLVLRSDLGGDPRFVEALRRVHRVVLDAHAHHDVSFEALVDDLQPQRDMSVSPLFQIAFDVRDPEIVHCPLPGVSLAVMEADLGAAQYDLHLTIEERGAELVAYWQYNSDLFERETVERMARNFETLLGSAVDHPELRLSRLALLAPGERERLEGLNRTAAPFPEDQRVHELFERWADRAPEAPAVVHGRTVLTYLALERRANQLADRLRELGVDRDTIVGVCLERSVETIVAILATLKAGGAFLPLDPAYPADRLRFMAQDSRMRLLITHSSLASLFSEPSFSTVLVDSEAAALGARPVERPSREGSSRDLAYVIYTSGSTGVPKGVMVEHHGWCNVSQAQHDVFGLEPGMRVLQFASLSFDASAFELAMALCSGGTLVVADQHALLPGPSLEALLREQEVDVVTLPPSALALLSPDRVPQLAVITVAGEACPAELPQRWARPGSRFFNLYGPTETTIWASYAECGPDATKPPPIGRPVPNLQLHVLDRHLSQLPIGMPGELYVGGEGVARGYLDRPQLTEQRFLPDAFAGSDARLYRTGDLVRRNEEGAVEFLGRIDHQVKLRGYRIELGEIEAALQRHPDVRHAVVISHRRPDGDQTLVAYVEARDGKDSGEPLRRYLRESLPSFMIPSRVVALERLPLTPSGKVDRRALPDPELQEPSASPGGLPQSDLERTIATVWQEVLDVQHVDCQQNFFDAGGHSLKLAQIHARLTDRLGIPIELVQLFQYPTVSSLASHLASTGTLAEAPSGATQRARAQRRVAALAERQVARRRDRTPSQSS